MSDEGRKPGDPEGRALGTDPFSGSGGTLPYLIRLRERSVRLVGEATPPRPAAPGRTAAGAPPPNLGPPVLDAPFEDPAEAPGVWDRLSGAVLDRADEERLNLVAHVVSAHPYDALGFSPRATRRALAVFKLLYRYYFRVRSTGHEQIPEKGGAILAGNHGGLLPFDGAMAVVDVLLRANPPRLLRTVVDRWAGTLPFVNVFYARVGQFVGTRDNFRRLLRSGQLVLTFPEGIDAMSKRAAQRYVLQRFHVGFVEESIRNRVPIIPMALVGADDQAPILWDVKPLARLLGLPVFPITPTFPWLGPLGLLPYPVRYQITYGEPFRFFDEYPPEVADDPDAVRYLAEQVRRRIQEMVDRGALARRSRET